jgi:hypothetical protein
MLNVGLDLLIGAFGGGENVINLKELGAVATPKWANDFTLGGGEDRLADVIVKVGAPARAQAPLVEAFGAITVFSDVSKPLAPFEAGEGVVGAFLSGRAIAAQRTQEATCRASLRELKFCPVLVVISATFFFGDRDPLALHLQKCLHGEPIFEGPYSLFHVGPVSVALAAGLSDQECLVFECAAHLSLTGWRLEALSDGRWQLGGLDRGVGDGDHAFGGCTPDTNEKSPQKAYD